MKDIYSRLKELGINLRSVTPPMVNYVNAVRIGYYTFQAKDQKRKTIPTLQVN